MALTDLTDQNNRMIQDYLPSLSNRQPGFDLAAQLQTMIDEIGLIQTGTGTVANGQTNVDIATFTDIPAGAAIVATISGAPNDTTHIVSAIRQNGTTVRVTVDQDPNNAGGCPVSVLVDARS